MSNEFDHTERSMAHLRNQVQTLADTDPRNPDAAFFEAIRAVRKAVDGLEVAYMAEHREVVRASMDDLHREYKAWLAAGESRVR